jgi:hypothetical protein
MQQEQQQQQQHEIIDNDGPPVTAPVAIAVLLKPLLLYIDPLGVWPLSMLFVAPVASCITIVELRNLLSLSIFVSTFKLKIKIQEASPCIQYIHG